MPLEAVVKNSNSNLLDSELANRILAVLKKKIQLRSIHSCHLLYLWSVLQRKPVSPSILFQLGHIHFYVYSFRSCNFGAPVFECLNSLQSGCIIETPAVIRRTPPFFFYHHMVLSDPVLMECSQRSLLILVHTTSVWKGCWWISLKFDKCWGTVDICNKMATIFPMNSCQITTHSKLVTETM